MDPRSVAFRQTFIVMTRLVVDAFNINLARFLVIVVNNRLKAQDGPSEAAQTSGVSNEIHPDFLPSEPFIKLCSDRTFFGPSGPTAYKPDFRQQGSQLKPTQASQRRTMSSIIILDGQPVTVTVSDLLIDLSGDEFHGNIGFTIAFDGPVVTNDVVQSLRLEILPSSQHHAETLEVLGHAEVEGGCNITMNWGAISQEYNEIDTDSLPETELTWNGDPTISIGRFPLKATEPGKIQPPSTQPDAVSRATPSSTNPLGPKAPPGILIQEFSRGQIIAVNWFDRDTPFTLVSGVIFTVAPILFAYYASFMPIRLFAIFFAVTGIIIFYHGVCKLFNKTRMEIGDSEFRISHGPLPWFKTARNLDRSKIKNVQTEKHKHTRRDTDSSTGTTFYSYELQVITDEKEKITVFKFGSPETALMLRDKLQEFLNLKSTL